MIPVRPAVAKMRPYNPPLEGRRNFLRLDFNENTVGCSPRVIEMLQGITASEIATYPEYGALKKSLSDHFRVPESQLMATNASDEGILSVFQTYLDHESEIVLPAPTFTMFRFYSELLDLKVSEVLYNPDLTFPEDRFLNTLSRNTKAVVLVNPNNPTGTPINRDFIIKLLRLMDNRLVLVDEAYFEFFGETVINLINDYKNLVVLRTFSKSFGMAGVRLGTVISHEDNIKNIAKAHSPYSISGITVQLAIAALSDSEYVKNYAKEVVNNREYLFGILKNAGLAVYPSSCNFLLVNFGKRAASIEKMLKEGGILARDRSSDPLLEGCIRITVGTKNHVDKLLNALSSAGVV